MSDVFVIRNQDGHYWGKARAWVDGADPRAVFRVKHQDEGVNTLFELSAKDVGLRGEVVAAELGPKGEPLLEVSDVPLPAPPEPEEPPEAGAPAETAGADDAAPADSAVHGT
jgi:hypothetical protein